MPSLNPKRGEVWLVELDPTRGSEIRKTRPVIVISAELNMGLPLRIIVPVTEWQNHFNEVLWMTQISPSTENGLDKKSMANAFQIRTVALERFIKKLGRITEDQVEQIISGVAIAIGF